MRERGRTIDAAASVWVVKIDRGLCETESAKLEEWLAGDTRRTGALARAQAAWVHADRAQVYRNASELRDSRSARAWRSAIPWASAAAVVLGLATAFLAWQGYSQTHFATKLGEIRRVPLADGSHITLDTQSRVSVRYEPATRLVRLETGEALFEVAKDHDLVAEIPLRAKIHRPQHSPKKKVALKPEQLRQILDEVGEKIGVLGP